MAGRANPARDSALLEEEHVYEEVQQPPSLRASQESPTDRKEGLLEDGDSGEMLRDAEEMEAKGNEFFAWR